MSNLPGEESLLIPLATVPHPSVTSVFVHGVGLHYVPISTQNLIWDLILCLVRECLLIPLSCRKMTFKVSSNPV